MMSFLTRSSADRLGRWMDKMLSYTVTSRCHNFYYSSVKKCHFMSIYPTTFILIITLLTALVPSGKVHCTESQLQSIERIIAIVNDGMVSLSDLSNKIDLMIMTQNLPNIPYYRDILKTEALNSLIDQTLLSQELKIFNYSVSQSEIDLMISHILGNINRSPYYSERMRIPMPTLLGEVRSNLLWQKFSDEYISPNIIVSDEDIDARVADLEPYILTDRRESHLTPVSIITTVDAFLPLPLGSSEAKVAMIERWVERLQKTSGMCQRFVKVFESLPPSISGKLNMSRGLEDQEEQMPIDLSKLIGLEPGETAPAVQTPEGWRVVMLCEREETNHFIAHSQLYAEQMEEHKRRFLGDLRRKAFIEIRL